MVFYLHVSFVEQMYPRTVLQRISCPSWDRVYGNSFATQHVSCSFVKALAPQEGLRQFSAKILLLPPPCECPSPRCPRRTDPLSPQCPPPLPCHHHSEGNKEMGGREQKRHQTLVSSKSDPPKPCRVPLKPFSTMHQMETSVGLDEGS